MRGGLLRGKPPLLFLRSGILAGQSRFLYAESRNKQNGRDIDMRFLLKILFAPILAALAVVTWFFVFVVSLSSGILCIPAAILGFFGLFILFVDSVSYGAGLLVKHRYVPVTPLPAAQMGAPQIMHLAPLSSRGLRCALIKWFLFFSPHMVMISSRLLGCAQKAKIVATVLVSVVLSVVVTGVVPPQLPPNFVFRIVA